ncbi:transcriptional regulator with XRE-family HTH domain [Saccharothrix tamanrassetensis]|uniref:Transcriptional regulator with XRE-family HTH domain n=1 Tax=Saccharothrix tamanrassetensis TaxID=1051531 RepID=A0A841CIK5_9PSEU|nr:helix-turn-helix transcriptional regulator [Saccharothrix tamanrassetensis]MBB5955476.1 transcriptional regulator with XRE-family HTH domain [Saccharothrix tamanrassetensis]
MTNPHRSAARIQVATTLRRLREDAGIPRERSVAALNCTPTKIGNIETAVSGIKQAELEKLLDLYGADDETREDLLSLNSEAHRRRPRSKIGGMIAPWLRRILDVEASATEALYSSFELVPAALQTEHYARAIMVGGGVTGEALEKNLELRAGRRALLTDREPPLRMWAVLAEPALRANIGGPGVMLDQVDHLLEMTELAHVDVQVMPQGAGAHMLTGTTLTLFRLPDKLPSLVSVDTPFGAHFVDRPDQVEKTSRWFDHTRAKALGVEESRELLMQIKKDTR